MRILLPFFNDSTLLFAARTQQMLARQGVRAETAFQDDTLDGGGLSERQLQLSLPKGPDHVIGQSFWKPRSALDQYDAIVLCWPTFEVGSLLADPFYRFSKNRPCFAIFWTGVELTPKRGIWNRRRYDVVFANNTTHAAMFREDVRRWAWQYVSYGHPYFLKPDHWLGDDPLRRNIYFFTQSIVPPTKSGRLHVLRAIAAIATANPDRTVWIKLRHLSDENTAHVNKEVLSYSDLYNELSDPPENLRFTARSMDEALADAALCLTCSSTAAMDAISAGVPTMLYLDYVEHYRDMYAPPARNEFMESGLVASLEDVLNLRVRPPAEAWLESRFREEGDLVEDLLGAITRFRTRKPFSQLRTWAKRLPSPLVRRVAWQSERS